MWIQKTFVPKKKLMKIWQLNDYSRGDMPGGKLSRVTEHYRVTRGSNDVFERRI